MDLRWKLTEVEAKRSALRGRLAETKDKLKGNEAPLGEVLGQLDEEKASATILRWSLDKVKSEWEVEKERATNGAVAAYKKSEAFNDDSTK